METNQRDEIKTLSFEGKIKEKTVEKAKRLNSTIF